MKRKKTPEQKKDISSGIFKGSLTRKGGVEKHQTGIKGFDEVFDGGIPKGRSLLITGDAGAGKTVFLNEFLYRGITLFKENGVFVTFEERPKDIKKNVKNFGWDYDSLIKQNKLAFVDASPEEITEVSEKYDLSPLIARIKYAIKKTNAKRVAIDSLGSLFQRFTNKGAIRMAVFRISDELKNLGVTSMISSEKTGEDALSRFGVEEFVMDGVIDLGTKLGQQSIIRTAVIRKMRGVGYRSGAVNFEIINKGVEVFPKIPIDRTIAKTSFSIREKFGLENFDAALGGGIPQGHMVLLGGNTGTGKTTIALQFLMNGLKHNESCIFVGLEEPIPQLKKTALEHNWDLENYVSQGKLIFVDPGLMDIATDKLIYQIVNAVNAIGARRVVFDSISSLESATMNRDQVREFLTILSGFFKTIGVTCILTYLTPIAFGASKDQLLSSLDTNEMKLSSIMDGIVILRFIERGQNVKKLLNIIKIRGSAHNKAIFQYEIDKEGFKFGDKFEI
jgi:circadian clock protein KaiC